MTEGHAELLRELARAVVAMDEAGAVAAAQRALAAGLDPYLAITQGLSAGMREVGDLYDRGEYFVPEILVCSDAMYAAIEVLKPHIATSPETTPVKVILGVIEGDIHDIGKNIVRIMLEAAGFDVHDLGRDVAAASFVAAAREAGAGIVGISTLMSTTLANMAQVLRGLSEAGLRDQFAVMIGGAPTSAAFARKIGADAHGRDASEAVALAQEFARRLPCPRTA